MPMNYAAQASATPTSGNTVVVSKPAGTVEGDELTALIAINTSGPAFVFIAPPGWALVGDIQFATGSRVGCWTKVAGASEPSSYTWESEDGSFNNVPLTDGVGVIVRYAPVSPTTPPGVIDDSAAGTRSFSDAVAPSVDATGNGDRLISLFAASTTAGATPSGMTQRAAVNGINWETRIYDEQLSQTGATGTRTWVGSGSTSVGFSVLLLANQQGSRIRMMI